MSVASFRRAASRVFLTFPASFAFLLFAMFITLFRLEVAGVLFFILLISALLVLCDDITVTTLPFLLLSTFSLKCYDSFDTFIRFAPLGIFPIAALFCHIAWNKRRFSVGKSFGGIVFVAVAVILGGAFSISFEEYISFSSLFYIAGLGVGMIFAYLIMKREFVPSGEYALVDRLLALFYMAGVFGILMLCLHVLTEFRAIRENGFYIQWSNNLSTLMMLFMPAPFYFALTRHRAHYFVGLTFYLALALTGSRGGFLMGGVELLFCLGAISRRDRRLRAASLVTVALFALLVIFGYGIVVEYFKVAEDAGIISENEARAHLIVAAIRDFISAPIFGQGIGYRGNQGIYQPVKGAANWYHMMLPQIIGSFGAVGIVAYGYQFLGRIRLIVAKRTWQRVALGLSYGGMLLMSQVNPGEFCPVPYELLTVLLFIFLELPDAELDGSRSGAFVRLERKNKEKRVIH